MAVAKVEAEGIEAYLEQHERKELLRFVAVGSVDDGKSTLIGRLLHDTQGIYDDQLAALEKASKRVGTTGGNLDFALLTDGLKAEREQGITIDVAYRYFSTEKRKFIIADTPGHIQYTRNMATGASTADVALILIDARRGVLAQSRRHAYIASLLGIRHLLVCVNKMDLVDYAEDSYREIEQEFSAFLAPLGFGDVQFLPISAVEGANVVQRGERTLWYGGKTVLEYLETVPIASDRNLENLRYPVQYVLRPDLNYRGFSGQVVSGVVRRGDEVAVLPSGHRTAVVGIDSFDGECDEAFAPMSVTLRLADEIDVSRGDMIVHPHDLPTSTRRFEAQVVWMNELALDSSRSYYLKHTTRLVRANIDRVVGKLDLQTLEEHQSEALELNDIGRLQISCNQALLLDPYADNRHTGAFVLIDALSNYTVAAGMVVQILPDTLAGEEQRRGSMVSDAARAAVLGQGGIALCFSGEPQAGQSEIAYALEQRLIAMGRAAWVIDVEAIADGTRSPALFADLASQCQQAGLIVMFSTGLPRASDRVHLRKRLGPEVLLWLDAGELDAGQDVDPGADRCATVVDVLVQRLLERGCFSLNSKG